MPKSGKDSLQDTSYRPILLLFPAAHPKIKISDAKLPLVRNPKLLGVYLDTFFSFNTHCVQVANRVSKRNVLKALAGTNWGQQKETLLLTYRALGRSIANYAAPVWSTNASDTSLEKIQRTHSEALRIITGSHKMSCIDHLHSDTKMLLVKDHLNLLSAQYLVHCLDTENVCHHITTMDHPPREMKETQYLARCLEPGNVCHPITTRATPERQMKGHCTPDIETL